MKKLKPISMAVFYLSALIIVIFICCVTSQTVTTSVWQSLIPNRTVFILDAGHGGIDGGATSCTGVLESHINLSITLRLNDLLHLLGHQTIMIRTTDTSIYTEGNTIASQKVSDLKNRVRIVNETKNGVLISIHQNTFSDQHYDGVQVFYGNHNAGKALAEEMQNELQGILYSANNRKAKKSQGIFLMENITNPGILIECGFISNPSDAAKLQNEFYQKKLCSVIAATLNRHKANT